MHYTFRAKPKLERCRVDRVWVCYTRNRDICLVGRGYTAIHAYRHWQDAGVAWAEKKGV